MGLLKNNKRLLQNGGGGTYFLQGLSEMAITGWAVCAKICLNGFLCSTEIDSIRVLNHVPGEPGFDRLWEKYNRPVSQSSA